MRQFSDGKPGRERQEGIDKYFVDGTYPIGRDIALVELSCSRDITDRVKSGSTRTVGKVWYSCRSNNPTSRVPLILKF